MPFLKNLFTIIFTVGLIVFVAWLIVPEIIAASAAVALRSDVASVLQLSKKPSHDADCNARGGGFAGDRALSGYQLRFENDTEYVIEAVCSTYLSKPFVVKSGKIFGLAKKIPGYSGVKILLTNDSPENWVVTGFWGRNWSVGYKNKKVNMMRIWDLSSFFK